jgi:hypothetical protein
VPAHSDQAVCLLAPPKHGVWVAMLDDLKLGSNKKQE